MKQEKNSNEIVVIHFNRDYEKGEEITKTIGKTDTGRESV